MLTRPVPQDVLSDAKLLDHMVKADGDFREALEGLEAALLRFRIGDDMEDIGKECCRAACRWRGFRVLANIAEERNRQACAVAAPALAEVVPADWLARQAERA